MTRLNTIRALLAAALLLPTASIDAQTPEIRTGAQLVQAMYDRYAGKWYRTLTFVQKTENTLPDGSVHTETWVEAAKLPGRLRIDILPLENGKGILFSNDTIAQLDKGAVTRSSAFVHPLLVLGFDVYAQPPARTIAQLEQLGFDLDVVHRDTWEGRPVYVVGAPEGDDRTKQFWVDDRMLFVRLLQPARDTTKVAETRFSKYERAGQTWIAPEVEFLVGGQRTTLESYSQVRTDVPLDDALFDAKRWSTVPHWYKPAQ